MSFLFFFLESWLETGNGSAEKRESSAERQAIQVHVGDITLMSGAFTIFDTLSRWR